MPYAISLKADNESASPLLDLWDEVSRFEDAPSMRALGYPPHVTLAVYDTIALGVLSAALDSVAEGAAALRLTFDRLDHFEDPLVLRAAPCRNGALHRFHEAVHEAIGQALSHPHYRPGMWIPHCTLGQRIAPDMADAARAFARRPMREFEVVFDRVDCASFYPVKVVRERILVHC